MPQWLISIAFRWGFSWGVSAVAGRMRENLPVMAALKKYRAGGTFKDICRAYAEQTPQLTDDQIVAAIDKLVRDLTIVPFKELVKENEIFILAGSTKIPDFDGDPSNDRGIAAAMGEMIDKTLGVETPEAP